MTRFPIRFTGANKALAILGATPTTAYVDVTEAELSVRFAFWFRATAPRSAIRSVAPDDERVWGWGVHGWGGEWLINGSSSGIVRIELDPPSRARVMGFGVPLRVLRVAVDDPDGLIAALGTSASE